MLGVVDILGKGAAKLSDPGALIQQIFEKPQELFGQFKDSIGDFKTLIANLPTLLWNKAKDVLAKAALEIAVKAVAKMAAKFGATGAFGLLFTLYGVIKFFIEEGKELIELFGKVKEMFTLAVRGGKEVITSIGGKVNEFITGAIPKLFKLLANVFEVGDLPGAVQKAFDKIQDTAQAPVIKLLTAMFAPIGRFLNKIFGNSNRRILTPPVPSKKVPGATVWLEEDTPKVARPGVDSTIRVKMKLPGGKEIEVTEEDDPLVKDLILLGRSLRTSAKLAKKANTISKAGAQTVAVDLSKVQELD